MQVFGKDTYDPFSRRSLYLKTGDRDVSYVLVEIEGVDIKPGTSYRITDLDHEHPKVRPSFTLKILPRKNKHFLLCCFFTYISLLAPPWQMLLEDGTELLGVYEESIGSLVVMGPRGPGLDADGGEGAGGDGTDRPRRDSGEFDAMSPRNATPPKRRAATRGTSPGSEGAGGGGGGGGSPVAEKGGPGAGKKGRVPPVEVRCVAETVLRFRKLPEYPAGTLFVRTVNGLKRVEAPRAPAAAAHPTPKKAKKGGGGGGGGAGKAQGTAADAPEPEPEPEPHDREKDDLNGTAL